MTNPNPELITDAHWLTWSEFTVPNARLGGMWANKSGYHSSVDYNQRHFPNNYSLQSRADTGASAALRRVSRATDHTLPRAGMIQITERVRDGIARNDPALAPVRDFFGTLDGTTVWGRSRTSPDDPWRVTTADSTHLWHGHTSFWAMYMNSVTMMINYTELLNGNQGQEFTVFSYKSTRRSDATRSLQILLNDWGYTPRLVVDGVHGDRTSEAVKSFNLSSSGDYGPQAFARAMQRNHGATAVATPAQLAEAISSYMRNNPTAARPTASQVANAVEGMFTINAVATIQENS